MEKIKQKFAHDYNEAIDNYNSGIDFFEIFDLL